MKISIEAKKLFTADLPKGTILVEHGNSWVTWCRKDRDVWRVSTCKEAEFECQNDTTTIELRESEILALAKIIRKS